jgi:hypothetical protein
MPDAFGVGLVLAARGNGSDGPAIAVEFTREAPQRLADASLERLRRAIPAARSLPLLGLLARRARGSTTLDYLDGLALRVEVAP